MTRLLTSILLMWASHSVLLSQVYDEYIGAGNTDGVTITSSSDFAGLSAINTINGSGMDAEKMAAARFLSQAAFGGSMDDIENLITIGQEAWLDDQLTKPITPFTDNFEAIWNEIFNGYLSSGVPEEEIDGPYAVHLNYTWWNNLMVGEDQLRQRVAYALSQILVISNNSNLIDYLDASSTYYDLLLEHALGNYKDLLLDVSLNVAMGAYLSHFNNPKADPANNIHPDENYAREIMQLFSIGLYELNIDGTLKLDTEGNAIPTYDNNDIKELAKVFTGLGPGDINMYVDWTNDPYFGLGLWGTDRRVPMAMYDAWHEQGSKTLLGTYVIPDGQSGMQDVEDAVDFLFNHENVGPFVALRMIQRLVKSNPSPEYIARVAEKFNNNGQGERGDMFAVVKQILLDEEARSCSSFEDPNNGKLKEPVLALAQFMKGVPIITSSGNFWNNGFDLLGDTGQFPLWAPSVFNFYTYDHTPIGGISDNDLVAPEFKIFNTLTSVGYLNKVHTWTFWDYITYDWEDDDVFGDNHTAIDETWLNDIIANEGPEELINYLDIVLTHGKISDESRTQMRLAHETLNWGDWFDGMLMIYLTMVSPDYMIDK